MMAHLNPVSRQSRAHVGAALTTYSLWWMEAYLAVVVLLRLGVSRVLDGTGAMELTLPMPPVPHPVAFGVVQVVVAFAWVYALTVTSRPLRAVVSWMAAGLFLALAYTWHGFASGLPNWHGLIGAAGFSLIAAVRHSLQWHYGAATDGSP